MDKPGIISTTNLFLYHPQLKKNPTFSFFKERVGKNPTIYKNNNK